MKNGRRIQQWPISADAPSAWVGEGNALPQRDAQGPKHRVCCTGKEEGKHKSYISFLRALNFMISPCYLEVNKDVPYISFPVFIFLAKWCQRKIDRVLLQHWRLWVFLPSTEQMEPLHLAHFLFLLSFFSPWSWSLLSSISPSLLFSMPFPSIFPLPPPPPGSYPSSTPSWWWAKRWSIFQQQG